MNGKLEESITYLRSAKHLETQTSNLYEALSKKINQPESSFILGFSCDSHKCAKVVEALLNFFDLANTENAPLRKDILELISAVTSFSKKIARTNNVDYEIACEFFRQLSALEDQLCSMYTTYLKSPLIKVLSAEFSNLSVDSNNFNRVFESMAEEKRKHREILLEVIYAFESKEAERFRSGTPLARHKSPDPQDSAFRVFPPTQIQQRTQT